MPRRVRESRPTLQRFCPDGIPYQAEVLKLIRRDWDYAKGTLEILLSGGYGSSKSVLVAHIVVTHCLGNYGARAGIARRSMPDLKETLFKEILEHLEDEPGDGIAPLREGIDYVVNHSRGIIFFPRTRAQIRCLSWADRRYKKLRSLKLSLLAIEEASENDAEDRQAFDEGRARLRRLPFVRENVLICATNPDDPDHWLHAYFIAPNEGGVKEFPNRFVFYSRTRDNIYLDPLYESGLREAMDERQVARFLESKWIRLVTDRIYYAYDADLNFRRIAYKIDTTRPIVLTWDFNIALGKPLSVAVMQKDGFGAYHVFGEHVVEGMRTEQSCDELAESGVLDEPVPFFVVAGDAAGRSRDTRNNRSDYDQIRHYLENYRTKDGRAIKVVYWVPTANPTVRKRHNLVNGKCCNAAGVRRLFVYATAPVAHQGMKLTALRKGGDYVEDDSKPYQHITTAIGYAINSVETYENYQTTRQREL